MCKIAARSDLIRYLWQLSWMGSYGHFSCKGSIAIGTVLLSKQVRGVLGLGGLEGRKKAAVHSGQKRVLFSTIFPNPHGGSFAAQAPDQKIAEAVDGQDEEEERPELRRGGQSRQKCCRQENCAMALALIKLVWA